MSATRFTQLTDQALEEAKGRYDFDNRRTRTMLANGLLGRACGFAISGSVHHILRDLKLLTVRRGTVTKLGWMFLWDNYGDLFPSPWPMNGNIHELKMHPEPFDAMARGDKCHEFRKNDRGFKVGDFLKLRRYDPTIGTYTGAELFRRITYVGTGFGIPEGFVCLSVAP